MPASCDFPITKDAPCRQFPETFYPAWGLSEHPPKIAVVHGSENQLFRWLQSVRGAAYTVRASIKDMGIDHGGTDVLVAQQLLNRAYVLAPLQ